MLFEECVVGMYVVINNPNKGYYSHQYDGCIAKITKYRAASVDLLVEDTELAGHAKFLYGVSPELINQLIQGDSFDDSDVEVVI